MPTSPCGTRATRAADARTSRGHGSRAGGTSTRCWNRKGTPAFPRWWPVSTNGSRGHTFRRTTEVDHHHDVLRFDWELLAPDGSVVIAGIDVGTLGPDGRLQAITGFFGDVAAMAAA
mgnify:CR=1 FL=1